VGRRRLVGNGSGYDLPRRLWQRAGDCAGRSPRAAACCSQRTHGAIGALTAGQLRCLTSPRLCSGPGTSLPPLIEKSQRAVRLTRFSSLWRERSRTIRATWDIAPEDLVCAVRHARVASARGQLPHVPTGLAATEWRGEYPRAVLLLIASPETDGPTGRHHTVSVQRPKSPMRRTGSRSADQVLTSVPRAARPNLTTTHERSNDRGRFTRYESPGPPQDSSARLARHRSPIQATPTHQNASPCKRTRRDHRMPTDRSKPTTLLQDRHEWRKTWVTARTGGTRCTGRSRCCVSRRRPARDSVVRSVRNAFPAPVRGCHAVTGTAGSASR
jgi:hypothetical protein